MPVPLSTAFHDGMPEIVVSNRSISQEVTRAARAGTLRKLASRLYTRNLAAKPETIVRRNLWLIVDGYFPTALVADRTAFENGPAPDGSICLVSQRGAKIHLPGLTLRPRRGVGPLDSDPPFIGSLHLSSQARALLENMRRTRARGGLLARTLSRSEIKARLARFIQLSGEDAANRLRDELRGRAPTLGLLEEAAALDAIIGALLGTRDTYLNAPSALARRRGRPYDARRLELFETLHAALRICPPVSRIEPSRSRTEHETFAFYEAYFSNFIEGTEFEVDEAIDIVFYGAIPKERPADAHDVLGSWRVVSDEVEKRRIPADRQTLTKLLRTRHSTVMAGRPDMRPGEFKLRANRAGATAFVPPESVLGTLERGFELYRSLERPFDRAVFIHFLIAEVHPFVDGDGRLARIMMNAELSIAREERIIIPTVFRDNYVSALKALSQNARPEPLIRALDYAQRWTAAVSWRTLEETRRELVGCNAFFDTRDPKHEDHRLRLPGARI